MESCDRYVYRFTAERFAKVKTIFIPKQLQLYTVRKLFIINYDQPFVINKTRLSHTILKSVQSALSDLLTTSATHGTFSRPSTKRGLILIGLELNTNAKELFEHY